MITWLNKGESMFDMYIERLLSWCGEIFAFMRFGDL